MKKIKLLFFLTVLTVSANAQKMVQWVSSTQTKQWQTNKTIKPTLEADSFNTFVLK